MKGIALIRACFLGLVAVCLLGNTLVSAICSIDEFGHEQRVATFDISTDDGCALCKDLFNAEHCCAHGVAPPASVAGSAHAPATGFVLPLIEFHLPANTASDVFRPPIPA
jgi:hypothetical protein